MKNLFERETIDEVISRIDTLQPAAERQWGKMDVAQMMAHCSAALDMASGKLILPRIFIGRLIGPLVKPIYWNEKPFSQTRRISCARKSSSNVAYGCSMRVGKRNAPGTRIPFSALSLRRSGAEGCTNI